LASNPPDAEHDRPPASIVSVPAGVRTTTPVTAPRSSVTSFVAFASKRTSIPFLAADSYSMSMSPAPPPTASRTRPPQKRNFPPTL
jgi:hypothetical protein